MSLKGFHVFFIVVAVLFCAGFTALAFLSSGRLAEELRIPGFVTAVLGLGLLAYGIWFVKKKASQIIVQ